MLKLRVNAHYHNPLGLHNISHQHLVPRSSHNAGSQPDWRAMLWESRGLEEVSTTESAGLAAQWERAAPSSWEGAGGAGPAETQGRPSSPSLCHDENTGPRLPMVSICEVLTQPPAPQGSLGDS